MHKIEAFILTDQLESTISALRAFQVRRIDFFEISNLGVNATQVTLYRGVSTASAYAPQIKLEIIVEKAQSPVIIDCLKKQDPEGKQDIFFSEIIDA